MDERTEGAAMAVGEPNGADEVRVPLAAETVEITKRDRVTGRVRIETRTEHRVEPIAYELRHEEVQVERVPVGRVVTEPPGIRQEGDVTVIPVLEEVVVIERRLMLTEEIRVRRVVRAEQHSDEVMLRSQRADIRRLPAEDSVAGMGPAEAMGKQNGE